MKQQPKELREKYPKLLSKYFPQALTPGVVEPFMHKGDWAIHEVLPNLLAVTGSADVRITTFSVSEDSLRPLFFLTEEGRIRKLQMLLDLTVKRHKLGLLLFAAGITPEIRIDSCHAKLLLVENEQYRFGICGSANLNQNHRWENGVYFTAGRHYDFFKEMFETSFAGGIPYDAE